jgi:hypothetical protein
MSVALRLSLFDPSVTGGRWSLAFAPLNTTVNHGSGRPLAVPGTKGITDSASVETGRVCALARSILASGRSPDALE